MKRLAIVGASGHGAVVADTAQQCGWNAIAFFDDAWPSHQAHGSWYIKGNTASLLGCLSDYDGVVVAIGSNAVRAQKQRELFDAGAALVSIVHPSAVISQYARIGVGSVIVAGAIVNTGAVVGDGVILNTGCSIDHDCMVGDYAHVSPGARLAGNVSVGGKAWVGIGASVCHGVTIGQNAVVGAGAAVIRDVADGLRVVGVPARPMRSHTA